jgi:anti-sigma B factor antagonist
MSDTPAAADKPITIEKTAVAIIARPLLKMMDDDALKTLSRLIDEASDADAPVPLVIVDLSRVAILPSMALGLLVQVSNKCRARQQKLKLAALQPQIRQVFSITRLDRVFQFADSVDAARE